MSKKESSTIFYSWQSDLPKDTNQRAIGSCIKSAIIPIEENNDKLKLNFDEATRGESGSPDIPSTIFNKILRADIFICDITTINHLDNSKRKTPNPNVLIELGFAISVLGWERIVMVFNKKFGEFHLELPFDLDKRRVTPFTISDKSDKYGKNDLTSKFKAAIETIINKKPLKPSEKEIKSEKIIRRGKDIANLKILMSCIHIETFDLFAEELPDRVIGKIFYFWYSFQGNYESNTFHIYDKELSSKLSSFKDSWGKTLSFGHLFHSSSSDDVFSLHLPMDVFTDEKTEVSFNELSNEAMLLRGYFKDLIIYIRENYLEVDVNELSQKAKQNYNDYKELA